jgi:hypothetical protein
VNTTLGIRHTDHVAPSIREMLAITSPTSGGRSVGIVRSRTQTMEYLVLVFIIKLIWAQRCVYSCLPAMQLQCMTIFIILTHTIQFKLMPTLYNNVVSYYELRSTLISTQ